MTSYIGKGRYPEGIKLRVTLEIRKSAEKKMQIIDNIIR